MEPMDPAVSAQTSDRPPEPAEQVRPASSQTMLDWLRREWALVLVLVIAAVGRFYQLATFPTNLLCDEVDNLRETWNIHVHRFPPIFGLDWKPQPALSQHMAAFFTRHLGLSPGPYLERALQAQQPEQLLQIYEDWRRALSRYDDIFAVRFPSAMISLIALVPFYYLVRRAAPKETALTVTLWLSLNPWYLNFSRSAWENVHIVLATLMALLGMIRVCEKRGPWWANTLLAGLGVAWGLYGYFSGRAIPLILGLAFLLLLLLFPLHALPAVRSPRVIRAILWALLWLVVAGPLLVVLPTWMLLHARTALWVRLLIAAGGIVGLWAATLPLAETVSRQVWGSENPRIVPTLGAIVVALLIGVVLFLPMVRVMLGNWDFFISRMATVSAFRPYPYEEYQTIWDLIRANTYNSLRAANAPINNTRRYAPPGEPLLHPVPGFLMVLGILIAACSFGRHFWWWLAFLVPLVTTQLLTTQAPHGARGLAIAPVLFYFAAVGLGCVQGLWYRLRLPYWPILLTIVAIFVAVQEVRLYIAWMKHPQTLIDRGPAVSLEEYPFWAQKQHLLLAEGRGTLNGEEWLAQRPQVFEELSGSPTLPHPMDGRQPLSPPPDTGPTPPPGLSPGEIHDRLHAEAQRLGALLAEPQGRAFNGTENDRVYVAYYNNTACSGTPAAQGWAKDLILRAVPERECSITWHTTLNVPADGAYDFALLTDDGGEVRIGGAVAVSDLVPHAARTAVNRVELTAGPHDLRLCFVQFGGAFACVLHWRPPGGQWAPIPEELLSTPSESNRPATGAP